MKIMVCYDNSEAAQNGLKQAIKHAKSFNGEILIVESLIGGTEIDPKKTKESEEKLETAKKFVEQENIKCETHLLIRGLAPGDDLVDFSNENSVDEIIIGIKRTSKVGKILFGSTAQQVILEAKCPVLSVK